MQLCFYVWELNYCRLFCTTYSLILMSILNSLFRCLQVLHRFYFSILFLSLPSLSLFFSASIIFFVLNSIYGFNHCDWLNSNPFTTKSQWFKTFLKFHRFARFDVLLNIFQKFFWKIFTCQEFSWDTGVLLIGK